MHITYTITVSGYGLPGFGQTGLGGGKINAIKELRHRIHGMRLKEAKDIVESPTPVQVLTDADAETAAAFRQCMYLRCTVTENTGSALTSDERAFWRDAYTAVLAQAVHLPHCTDPNSTAKRLADQAVVDYRAAVRAHMPAAGV